MCRSADISVYETYLCSILYKRERKVPLCYIQIYLTIFAMNSILNVTCKLVIIENRRYVAYGVGKTG